MVHKRHNYSERESSAPFVGSTSRPNMTHAALESFKLSHVLHDEPSDTQNGCTMCFGPRFVCNDSLLTVVTLWVLFFGGWDVGSKID